MKACRSTNKGPKSGNCLRTPVEVSDVTGAGDTVAAILAIALALGFSLRDAAACANLAGGLAVRHPGNWAVSPEELLRAGALS